MKYTPSPWQSRFHALTTHQALGAGSAGPGKSLCLLMDPVQQIRVEDARAHRDPRLVTTPDDPLWNMILENPIDHGESSGWALFLMRTSKRLLSTIRRAAIIFRALDPLVKHNRQDDIFEFSSGFRYQFGHCHLSGDWENYMSNEFTAILFDELVHFEEEQYFQIKTRLRSSDAILRLMTKVRAMSNPVMRLDETETIVNKDPHWVRRYFVEPHPEGNHIIEREERDPETGHIYVDQRIYLPARLDDNPDKEFIEDYKRNLLHAKPHIRKALLEGDWYVVPGAFYEDVWDEQLTVVRPFAIPLDWAVFRSMDWGFKSFGCIHWWALDDKNNLFCFREMTFRKRLAKQVAQDVKQAEQAMGLWGYNGSRITGPADTQLWEERGGSGLTKAEEFDEEGVNWTKANKKSRKRNSQFLTARLQATSERKSAGGFYMFPGCSKLRQTIPAMQTDPDDPEVPADGGDDHWPDSCFYACNHASRGRSGIPRMRPRFRPDDEDDNDNTKRGRLGYGL